MRRSNEVSPRGDRKVPFVSILYAQESNFEEERTVTVTLMIVLITAGSKIQWAYQDFTRQSELHGTQLAKQMNRIENDVLMNII